MTRKPIVMLVDDNPIDIVEVAKVAEHHGRIDTFRRLCNEGHVRVLEDDDPTVIRCRVEQEVFSCARDVFPTVELMARLQLAVAAGQSCTKLPSDEFQRQADYYRLKAHMQYDAQKVYDHQILVDDAITQGYHNTAVTAAVKRERKQKSKQGGLRP